MFTLIREWAEERGIYHSGDVKTQMLKLTEEKGELAKAVLKNDKAEFEDAIGDMFVVLVNVAELGNKYFYTKGDRITMEKCIFGAWEEIQNRKGEMINGTFVKAQDNE